MAILYTSVLWVSPTPSPKAEQPELTWEYESQERSINKEA